MRHHPRAGVIAACCADDSPVQSRPDASTCTEVVSADRLVQLLHERAQAAVDAGSTVRAMPVSLPICIHCRCRLLANATAEYTRIRASPCLQCLPCDM